MSHPNLITSLPEYLEGEIALDTETKDTSLRSMGPGWAFPSHDLYVAGVSICCENLQGYVSLRHPDSENMDNDLFYRWLDYQLTRREDQPKIFANAIYDVGWFRRYGVNIRGPIHDILIQVPLLDEHLPKNSYNLDATAQRLLGSGKDLSELEKEAVRLGIPPKDAIKNLWRFPARSAAAYATKDAVDTLAIWKIQSRDISEQDLQKVYDLEMSLTNIFIDMRMRGVHVDLDYFEKLKDDFRAKQREAGAALKHETGVDITDHPWETKGIVQILDQLGIKYPLTPKTQKPSIKGDWLDQLDHPIAGLINKVRGYDRAVGTFIESYIFGHQVDGKIHASFSQLRDDSGGTISGRLSSSNPNLQNIPARDPELGIAIRKGYIPSPGKKWLAVDYASQEPRWTVHFAAAARCKGGEEAAHKYRTNPKTDYHQMVADMCKIPRPQAKIINLGVAYGMGGYKLCISLGLPTETVVRHPITYEEFPLNSPEGQECRGMGATPYQGPGEEGRRLLKQYHENAPFIRSLGKKCQQAGKNKGYIRTILGRRCRFPLVGGERWYLHTAMNRLIQGSSADQTKTSIYQLHHAGFTPLLSVHDENDFEIEDDPKIVAAIVEIMEQCIPDTHVPFLADPKVGNNWGECK